MKRLLAGGVAADSDENIVFAGNFEGSVDFGGGVLLSAGEQDAFGLFGESRADAKKVTRRDRAAWAA